MDTGPWAVIAVVHGDAEIVVGEVAGRCDVGLVDGLARLQLAAGRLGAGIRLREVRPPLRELLELAGLTCVLAADGVSVEVAREPEGSEQLGIEEVVDGGDSTA